MYKKLTSLILTTVLLTLSGAGSATLAISSSEELGNNFVSEGHGTSSPDLEYTPLTEDTIPAGFSAPWDALTEARTPSSTPAGGVEPTDCGDRTPHPPIVIQGDDMFKLGAAVGVLNPEADGTADEPYVIEGWCIMPGAFGDTRTLSDMLGLFFTAHNARERGIAIADTEAHVIVRDNLITGTANGTTDRFQIGVSLHNSTNAEIVGNTILNTGLNGISLIASNDVTIRDNSLTGSLLAVEVKGTESIATVLGTRVGVTPIGNATGISVHGNVLDDNVIGVAAQRTHAINIHENAITGDSSLGAIGLSQVDDAIVYDNTLSGTFYGLFLYQSHRANLSNNDLGVTGLIVEGDLLEQYEHTIDASNMAGGEPIRYVYAEEDMVVAEPAGQVFLAGTTGAQVNGLDLSGPRYEIDAMSGPTYGIVIAFATDTSISDTAIGGSQAAIRIHDSNGTQISSSTIIGNGWIYGFNLDGISLHNNTISNGNYGLYFWGVQGLNVYDNLISNHLYGLYLSNAQEVAVHDNTITENSVNGLYLSNAQEVAIHGNTITNSGVNGLIVYNSAVDARNNWWGAANGPSSGAEEVEDACSGTIANGSGDRVAAEPMFSSDGEEQAWWGIANEVSKATNEVASDLCFEPWLSSPNPDAGAA